MPLHLNTNLPVIRGMRSIGDIADASGVNPATIRQIEQGKLVPRDVHIAPLERAYGRPWPEWYSRWALAALQEGDAT